MGLFGWVVVGNSSQSAQASTSNTQAGAGKPINHADYKQFGFENFGNTCYANSILQALYFCQPFRDLICEAYDSSNPPIPQSVVSPPVKTPAPPPTRPGGLRPFRRRDSTLDTKTNDDSQANGHAAQRGLTPSAPVAPAIPTAPPSLFSALRSLFLHITTNPNDKGKISPTAFIEKVKAENPDYRSTMHQDAHEFLGFLLNKIVEDIEADVKKAAENVPQQDLGSSLGSLASTTAPSNSSSSQRQFSAAKTFVHALFEGVLTSETRCLSCETVSSREESFLDLSIDIEQNSSVTACLRQFSASEMLSQKNKFFCDCCGSLQEAEKRMKIKKLPNVLALHLKRFKYQEDLQRYIKLSYRVAFPFELRLFNTVDDAPDPDRLYQLFAIVVHIGNGPNHGHYISIVRAHGSWFVFDDDNVDPIRETEISKYFGESQNGAGYVLFYQAVDLEGLGPIDDPTADEKPVTVDVDGEQSVSVSITVNDTSASAPDGSSPEVAIVVQDEPQNLDGAPERPVPAKLTIPTPTLETAMDAPTPVVSTVARPTHEASISAIPAARSSASVINGFSETATVSSDSSTGAPGLFIQAGETSSLATTQASLSPMKAPTSTSVVSSSNFLARTLKHSQSAKVINGDNERNKRRTANNGGAGGMSAANEDIPPVPSSPSLSRSKSFRTEVGWFSSKRKSEKEKERLAIPTPRTSIGGTSSSPHSSVEGTSIGDMPVGAMPGSLPNGKHPSVIPPSPSAEQATYGKAKSKSSRPSTAPSSATKFTFDDLLPPIPASPQLSHGATSPSISSSLAFPSSPVPPSPSRKASQHLPPPAAMPPPVGPPLTEQPPSSISSRAKRISRKSLTGISLTAMFGRKDKEKASDNLKDDAKSPIMPRRPSLMASGG